MCPERCQVNRDGHAGAFIDSFPLNYPPAKPPANCYVACQANPGELGTFLSLSRKENLGTA